MCCASKYHVYNTKISSLRPQHKSKHVEGKINTVYIKCDQIVRKSIIFHYLSVDEMKNNCCLFESLFKIQKNGAFLFGISFFVLEILQFLH